MTLYLLGVVQREDPDIYAKYEEGAYESLVKYGVEPMAVDDSPFALEGSLPGGRVVLLRFRDREHLDSWYKSPEYQKVKPLRMESSETKLLVAFQGLE